jgi:hypothetical protein
VSLAFDPALKTRLSGVSQEAIAGFWEHLARRPHEATVEDLRRRAQELSLNDWGVARLAHRLGRKAYEGEREAVLFAWFALTKLGYRAKAGFSGEDVYLLMPTRQALFSVPYFSFEGEDYYVMAPQQAEAPRSVKTYEGEYPGDQQDLSLRVASGPRTATEPVTRKLAFEFRGETHRLSVRIDRQRVRYFKDYPQTDFPVYFGARPGKPARQDLLASLRPLVEGKSESEAVNLLLRFAQTAFEYETDQEQFGREKPMFAEETLYYSASDCEDRAVLFAYLVRQLVGLEVVGLHYPGHLATAVRFSGEMSGATIRHNGARYVVADPTYINADAGQLMPRLKGETPEIVPLSGARRARSASPKAS